MVSRRSSHGGEEDGNIHLSFSNSLREIERWRSKKNKETLGWNSLSPKGKVARKKKKEKGLLLIQEMAMGPTTYSTPRAENTIFRALDGFDKGGRIVRRNFQFPKSIYFKAFGDIENSVQILCKKTISPLSIAKQGLEVQNGNGADTKVVGNNKIN